MMRRECGRRWLVRVGCLFTPALWSVGVQAKNLTVADVKQIVSAAAQEANARGQPATITVVDRVGNVLAVFQMNGAPARVSVTTNRGIVAGNGLERVEAVLASAFGAANSPSGRLSATAKAITGAYLSSSGNAFTTRTASQIIQEHFNPGESFSPSGPLFGVQFTQLPCSDLSVRQATTATITGLVSATAGPKRSPPGLSAAAAGLPRYKHGQPAAGVGVHRRSGARAGPRPSRLFRTGQAAQLANRAARSAGHADGQKPEISPQMVEILAKTALRG